MAVVDILDVTTCQSARNQLAGFSIDLPRANSHSDAFQIEVGGWVLGPDGPAEAVELRHRDRLLRRVALDIPRRPVAEIFPQIPNAQDSGFWTLCGVMSLGTEFEIEIDALLGGDHRVRLGTIRGRHQPVQSSFEPALQPLMVTSLGRTGTTWLMRLLSQHPAIIAHPAYPYEIKCASYWIHMFTVLAEPANLSQSAHPDTFDTTPFWVGHHPFHSVMVTGDSSLREWFGKQYVEDVAGFCQQSIENFYVQLGQTQGRRNLSYFAEKHTPEPLPRIMWELYPKAREVFLVRDFRDMVCSILAFNARRGVSGFGRDRAANDEAYLLQIRDDARKLLGSWRERSTRAHLVRYEDLILQPEPTLDALFTYLELDRSSATIRGILERASIETDETREHRTTSDPRTSIGRWRRELPPHLRDLCDELFSDLLPEFGYAAESGMTNTEIRSSKQPSLA